MINEFVDKRSKWLRDLIRFLPLKSQFVLSGNARDLQVIEKESGAVFQPFNSFLNNQLMDYGYTHVLFYDQINGFVCLNRSQQNEPILDNLMKELGIQRGAQNLSSLIDVLEKVVLREGEPIAVVIDYASRIIMRQGELTDGEHSLFLNALIRSQEARSKRVGDSRKPFYNTLFWIVDKEGDLPDWLLAGNSKLRHISIPTPDNNLRLLLAKSLVPTLNGAVDCTSKSLETAIHSFVDSTDGLLLADMKLIVQLCNHENLNYLKISEAVRRYKVGVAEDPWQKIDRTKIHNGQNFIMERVKGQDHALEHMLDIIKRAVTGVGAPKRGCRPRGIAFLAGPTGVGKTELAKSVTSLLFGDESAYIRFDMSEFSAEHSDQRLIGAPPGYVGYDVGGELTNAIREKPFSVILFDEIEKAHPRILDKFLQVLDDGVLTSGRGEKVYFTEAFIIFTSNLGIHQANNNDNSLKPISVSTPFETIQKNVRDEIEKHFKFTLNRPEILNRIGDNIIVFDFIRSDVAKQIFGQMVSAILEDLKVSRDIFVVIEPKALEILEDTCLDDLSNGGRGIRNKVELHLLNPLSRMIFDENINNGTRLNITDVSLGKSTKLNFTYDQAIDAETL